MKLSEIASEISISTLATSLFLGAGASISSGAMNGHDLATLLRDEFLPEESVTTLAEIASRVEFVHDRKALIQFIRSKVSPLVPSPAFQQISQFFFQNIFTTNYDRLVERSFELNNMALKTVRSNRDFSFDARGVNTTLYKLHGCITEDRIDGNSQGMIVTEDDYNEYKKYRDIGFQQFDLSLKSNSIIFIGYSLKDENIKSYVNRAFELKTNGEVTGNIYIVQFRDDAISYGLWERRGAKVASGDLDSFLAEMLSYKDSATTVPILSPSSKSEPFEISNFISADDVHYLRGNQVASVEKMLSGSPANYKDVIAGNTFERVSIKKFQFAIDNKIENYNFQIFVGPSGSGKTTAARYALSCLLDRGFKCFEHKRNIPIDSMSWINFAIALKNSNRHGAILFDEMNASQFAVNEICDAVEKDGLPLVVIVCAHPTLWRFRTKSKSLASSRNVHDLSSLQNLEVNSVVKLAFDHPQYKSSLAHLTRKFTRIEAHQYIQNKAQGELFVCLKYLFDQRSLDEIIINEYKEIEHELPSEHRATALEIYKKVSLLESSGTFVHRAMLLRVCKISAEEIEKYINMLDGIVFEDEFDVITGVYNWKTRHPRIAKIIADSKYRSEERFDVIMKTVIGLNSAYQIERNYAGALCNTEKQGIEGFSPEQRHALYEQLVNSVPSLRLPWHRLVKSLIDRKEFSAAENAISACKENGINDAVISRYEILNDVERAINVKYYDDTDRINIIEQAILKSKKLIEWHDRDMHAFRTYNRVAFEYAKITGDAVAYHEAIKKSKAAYLIILDNEMLTDITKHESEILRLFGKI